MQAIGLTGGFATGKTTVARMFRELGAKVISADAIAKNLMRPYTPVWKEVLRGFGKIVMRRDNFINRDRLAAIIFSDDNERRKLNRIVHPAVIEEIKKIIIRYSRKNKIIIADIPLLFETGMEHMFDKVIVVKCLGINQFKRAVKRKNISDKRVIKCINIQIPLIEKEWKADFIIDNSYGLARTRKQVKSVWRKLTKKEDR